MKLSIKVENIINSIKRSFKRFPVTILNSTAVVILLIILSERGLEFTPDRREMFIRFTMTIALGIPLSACIKYIFERIPSLKISHEALGYSLGIALLVLYYFLFLKDLNWISITRYVGISLFLYLAFLYIPWIKKKDGYEYYIIDILYDFLITAVYSFVLFIGILIIIFTIVQLFNVDIPDKITYYTFLIIAGIFAPSLFLARVPEVHGESFEIEYPKSLRILLLYIVIPLITVYSTILYAYFLKIIVTRNWPQGLVSHLVLWYSIVSVVVIFLISPILKDNRLAYRFKNFFPKFILPILAMMFISMGIRIKAYGITENRYFALVLGIWVLGTMIYFSLKKKLTNIVIPVSLSIVVILSVFGPVSSFSISKLSQNNRLKSLLERNGMLIHGTISKKEDIPIEDKEEISAILMYFQNKHSFDDVKYIPDKFEIEDMESVFGFPYIEKGLGKDEYFSYFIDPTEINAVDVKEYDYFIYSNALYNGSVEVEDLTISCDDNIITIAKGKDLIYEKDLKEYVEEIIKAQDAHSEKYDKRLNPKNSTFVDENEMLKTKILLTNIAGRLDGLNDEIVIDYIEFHMLMSIK